MSPRCCWWSARWLLRVTGPGRWPRSTSTGTVWPPGSVWHPRRRPTRSAGAYWQASRKSRSLPVLATPAFAPDQDVAWSLAGRLLGQASRLLAAPTAILAEPEASAPAGVAPGLAVPAEAAIGGLDDKSRAFALQGAVRLLAAVARPRCLIVIDDLQWPTRPA